MLVLELGQPKWSKIARILWHVWMYPQFHSVQELSKNHDIWFQVLFGSLWIGYGSVLVPAHFFTFAFGLFSSWQNLGFGSVCSCWVRFLYHFLFAYLNIIQCQQLWDVVCLKSLWCTSLWSVWHALVPGSSVCSTLLVIIIDNKLELGLKGLFGSNRINVNL